jgi:hypothetical protein
LNSHNKNLLRIFEIKLNVLERKNGLIPLHSRK